MSSKKNLRQTLLQVSSNLDFSKCESLADEFKVVKKAYLRKALKTHPGTYFVQNVNVDKRDVSNYINIHVHSQNYYTYRQRWIARRISSAHGGLRDSQGYVQERKSNEFF